MLDQDGGETNWNSEALFASRDETVNSEIEPGQELRVRYYFSVPANLPLKSASFQQRGNSRIQVHDLSNMK